MKFCVSVFLCSWSSLRMNSLMDEVPIVVFSSNFTNVKRHVSLVLATIRGNEGIE